MIEKVKSYIKKNNMLREGDTVVAGISGGADSVCLLFILIQLRKEISFRLSVVHINHRIRAEAGEDARFVEALCGKWNCDFYCIEEDVREYAAYHAMSEEEAGRAVRYGAFQTVLTKMGAPEGKIAVAHNQNDNAETVLFHLMRGCGLSGLAGIPPVREHIIRPLLCVSRPEIEAYLEKNGVPYCIDRTNNEDTYTRNKIRHHIVAYGEKEICEKAVSHIYDTSVIMKEMQDYIQVNTKKALERCMKYEKGDIIFQISSFLKEHPLIQKQCILAAIEEAAGSKKDIAFVHVEGMRQLFFRKSNGQIDLPYKLTVYREYDRIRLTTRNEKEERKEIHPVLAPGETCWKGEMKLLASVFSYEKSQNIPEKTYTKWFDYDKIVKSLVVRTRQTGDYLEVYANGGRKSLKSYFIEEKIPRAKRDSMPLLADGNHIVWIIGRRISEHYKIDNQTKTVLQIQVTGGTSDGRENQDTVNGRRSK